MSKRKPKLSLGLPKEPQKTQVPEQVAASFTEDAQAPRCSEAQTPERLDSQQRPAKSLAKRHAWRRFTLYLPPDLAKKLKLAAASDDGRDMSSIAAEALALHLEKLV